MVLLLLSVPALAENIADYGGILEFAQENGSGQVVQDVIEGAFSGELNLLKLMEKEFRQRLSSPLETVLGASAQMLAPILLLALLGTVLPDGGGATMGAGFLLRLMLLKCFSELALTSLSAAQGCLHSVKRFTDAAAPAIAAIIAALGLEGSATLVSPAAALAGGLSEGLFLQYGLPLCRIALCSAVAGNLSPELDLSRFTNIFRKLVNWTAGLATTLFTSLLALQGSISVSLDSVAVKTAKFAVDSAAPVIGSGVSDAWESYASGIMISKNALGVSGITALLFSCAQPMLQCLAALLVLTLIAAALELFGEKITARAAGQIAGVCQMALSLCTASLAIGTILLGAVMAIGRGLVN